MQESNNISISSNNSVIQVSVDYDAIKKDIIDFLDEEVPWDFVNKCYEVPRDAIDEFFDLQKKLARIK